ncbi:MAG: type II secretion system F family protein [bacterium]|nr:type II secretion system F family protein [bacterium]
MTKEVDYFIENLATFTGASISVTEALDALIKDTKSRRMIRMIGAIREDVDSGVSLSKALESTNQFPEHVISLIRIGEESGRLPENLKVVGREMEKDRELKSKLRSAMAYPLIVLFLTLVIGIGVAWFILPNLAKVFSQLDIELPVITTILINFGIYLGLYGSIVIPIFLISIFSIVYIIFFYRRTNFIGERILFVIPGIKELIRQVEIARFGYVMGNLLDAGLPIVPALVSLEDATNFYVYRHFYKYLNENIESGNSFEKSFDGYPHISGILPVIVVQMILAAEKSGTLPQTFIKIGEIYEAKTEITIKNITIVLEPILLVIVWLGVLAVAVAIILPIYSLIGKFNP